MSEQSLKKFERLYSLLTEIYIKMNSKDILDRNLLYQVNEIMRTMQLYVKIPENIDSAIAGDIVPLVAEDLVFDIQGSEIDEDLDVVMVPGLTLCGNYMINNEIIFETNLICFYPEKGFETIINGDHYVSVEIQIKE